MILKAIFTAAVALLAGCSTMQATPYVNSGVAYAPSSSGQVDVLYSAPQRPYTSIGIVSARRYKPGFTDPSVSDAIPQLRGAAAQIGADGVIVRGTVGGGGTRLITVEGEAIRYTDKTTGAVAGTTMPTASMAGSYSGDPEAAALSFATTLQCARDFRQISKIDGRTIYSGTCTRGDSVRVECGGGLCRKLGL